MPRNIGTGIYVIPPDTEGIPDQTIESAPYNTYIHDVETDLNNARPIIAGGTGANDADEALFNLGGEKSTQLVTNYDTHVWVPGSFRSASSATAGPVDGHAFAGIVYINEPYVDPPTNANVVVSARDMNDTVVPSRVYVREKKVNVWGAWTVIDATTLPFPPSGDITADTILEAIQELDAEKASLVYVNGTFAPIASPLFTGDARAPTPAIADNDTTIATTAFVQQAISTAPSILGATAGAVVYNGLQLNGAFEVNQTGGPAATATGYVTDCWKLIKTGTMGVNASINTYISMQQKGFEMALTVSTTATQTSLGAGDGVFIQQPIEGFRVVHMVNSYSGAQPMTLGFWSINNAGLYSGSISSGARSYVFTYTQAVSGTPQYNVINIPASAGGSWQTDIQAAMFITFTHSSGSTYTAPSINTWLNGLYYSASGQNNGAATIGLGGLSITGVVLLPGTLTLTAANSAILMRSSDVELQLCKRYYEETPVYWGGYTGSSIAVGFSTMFSVEKRIAPTPTVKAGSSSTNFTLSDFSPTTTKNLGVRGSTSGAGAFLWSATVINDARM